MDGLQARLDRAIEEAREAVLNAAYYAQDQQDAEYQRIVAAEADAYAALVALRARYEEHELEDRRHTPTWCSRCERLTAEAERLCGKIEGRGAEDTRPHDTSR